MLGCLRAAAADLDADTDAAVDAEVAPPRLRDAGALAVVGALVLSSSRPAAVDGHGARAVDGHCMGPGPSAQRHMRQLIAFLCREQTVTVVLSATTPTHSMDWEEPQSLSATRRQTEWRGGSAAGRQPRAALWPGGRLPSGFSHSVPHSCACHAAAVQSPSTAASCASQPEFLVCLADCQLRLTATALQLRRQVSAVGVGGRCRRQVSAAGTASCPIPGRSVAGIFEAVEARAAALRMLVYQVAQASLEEIILRLAEPQAAAARAQATESMPELP